MGSSTYYVKNVTKPKGCVKGTENDVLFMSRVDMTHLGQQLANTLR